MTDATGVAEAMLGLPGFRVLDVHESASEVVIGTETTTELVGCPGCGVVAGAHDRMQVDYRDLAAFGRPARLRWAKRRWRCEEPACAARTWTETSPALSARCLLTDRAGAECCRQVGRNARPVSQMADELGVCWDTVMAAVREHGKPLVDNPDRVGEVRALGVDETTFLSADTDHPTRFATGLVDLEGRVVIDVILGNASKDLGSWLDGRTPGWLAGVEIVATDLAESYRAGLAGRLDHAIRVADPFHVVRLGNRCLDQVRRRAGNRTLGHRGRKCDPLYRIRTLMLMGAERLDGTGVNRMLLGMRAGDPEDEVLGAWLAKESVRDVYLTGEPADAETLLDKTIEGCRLDPVPEVGALGRILARWRTEILAHHTTGASNGPTEGLNLLIKKVKRVGHGFRSFATYRPRILLHAGGVNWPAQRPPAPRIRTRSPHQNRKGQIKEVLSPGFAHSIGDAQHQQRQSRSLSGHVPFRPRTAARSPAGGRACRFAPVRLEHDVEERGHLIIVVIDEVHGASDAGEARSKRPKFRKALRAPEFRDR